MAASRALLAALFAFCTACAHAAPSESPADTAARAWLKKIQTAAQRQDYAGTFVYQQSGRVRTSRIAHIHDGKTEIEKLEILDGKPRVYLRKGEEVTCYVPEEKLLIVERRVTRDIFPALPAADAATLADRYTISRAGSARVAGRDSQAILLKPRDNLRYGYKLWAEKSSGLLLRAQTLDDKNDVIEQISFTQISIGKVDRKLVRPDVGDVSGWRVEQADMEFVTQSDWRVASPPAGFRKIREVRRLMTEDGAGARSRRKELLQIVYSDGLAAVSVFIEPDDGKRPEGTSRQGALHVLGKRHGEFWLTIVGEVPMAAIRQIAESTEFKPKR